ncbi:hypothetical protein HED60_16850 [Planctomycetales bacterium ZRK34]|nr:hypothetical protein HED60_16850 [Planctomycetales bacterium ZRK34]
MKTVVYLSFVVCLLGAVNLHAEVRTYAAPEGEKLSDVYRVTASGKTVDVYAARVLDAPFDGKYDYGGPYSFANFDTDGPVEVTITAARSLKNTVVRPARADVALTIVDDHTLKLRLPGPIKLSVEPDGRKGPLLLFANPMEVDPPKPGDPNVIYFGPGIHKPEKIEVRDNQTLYLAGGAVVKGGVDARGQNITIRGRGILDGSDWPWRKGPTDNTIMIRGSHVIVEGITIRGAPHWTIVPRHSQHVTIRNVKLCNSRVQNDDGINPCNSQDVLITDCFIRSDDDCVAMKGINFEQGNSNVERIVVENSVLWCDRARIFLLGHESRAEFMRDITLRNLDIIHYTMIPFLFEPGEEMRLQNVTIENVRLHGEGQAGFIRLRPVVNQYMHKKVPGHVQDIRFRHVQITGEPGGTDKYLVQIIGADAEHQVRQITLEDVTINGQPVTADSPNVRINDLAQGIEFEAAK